MLKLSTSFNLLKLFGCKQWIKLPAILGILILCHFNTQAQTFLNGDFEINSCGGTDQINMSNAAFNAVVPFNTSFGTYGDLDMIISATYGGLAQHGNWYTALTGGGTDQLSLQLSAPLVAGTSYTISFYDRADAGFTPYPFVIGLSTTSTSLGTPIYTTPSAAVAGVWTQRLFTFVAPNNGQFITVTMTCCGTSDWSQIDNFTFVCGGLNLGPDTALCSGSNYILDATTANATAYLWQDNSTSPTYTVSSPGTYWVQVTATGCTMSDTVVVSAGTAPVVNLGNDTSLCNGQSLILDAGNPGATYHWQDASTGQTLSASQTGTYWVNVTNQGCTASDTIQLNFAGNVSVNLGNDTAICNNNTVVLNATTSNATYLWQDNSTGSTYTVTTAGTYWVQVTAFGCVGSDTVVIGVGTTPVVNLGNDTSLCNGQSLILNAGNPGAMYHWQNASTGQTLSASQSGMYWVNVTNLGCTASDTIQLNFANTIAVNLGNDTAICPYDTLVLHAATANATYLWQDHSTNVSYNVTQSGTYSVTVSVSGCTGADSILVNLHALPVATASAANDSICSTDSTRICATNGFAAYAWNTGKSSSCIYAGQAGNYYVTVTDNNGCTAESNHFGLHVYPLPPVSISVNADTLRVYNAVTVQWYLNGSPIGGATSAMLIASTQGTYTVSVTDANGCTTFSSPVVLTGIGNIENDAVQIYPNPLAAGNWQLVTGDDLLGSRIEIFDDNGRMVYQSQLTDTHTQIELNVARGIYLLRIYSTRSVVVKKLVKL